MTSPVSLTSVSQCLTDTHSAPPPPLSPPPSSCSFSSSSSFAFTRSSSSSTSSSPSDRLPSLLLLSALFSAQFPSQLEPQWSRGFTPAFVLISARRVCVSVCFNNCTTPVFSLNCKVGFYCSDGGGSWRRITAGGCVFISGRNRSRRSEVSLVDL